jgi:uncharacterized protein (UPF0264 family)
MTVSPEVNRVLERHIAKGQHKWALDGSHTVSPKLLVSVRSRAEAELAIVGGAEILDVKEPSLGSLGMASIEEIHAIATLEAVHSKEIPLSVALGEVVDWQVNIAVPGLPANVTFAKLGLSQCALNPDWIACWQHVRAEFQAQSASDLNWVAVAYADATEAASPAISEVLGAAIETGCSGLLIDTWTKDGRVLLDHVNLTELVRIADLCHTSGMFLALAGRLNQGSLPDLSQVPADVIAIRSAACKDANRTAEIHSRSIAAFKRTLEQSFSSARQR